jgi:opacity protein-like surface antigen
LHPYGTAGIGVIRAVFETSYELADTDQNNLGFNIGGGLMYSLNNRVGLRGDLRYFRALVDEEKREGGFFQGLRLLACGSRRHTRAHAVGIGFCQARLEAQSRLH